MNVYERITYGNATLHDKETDIFIVRDKENLLSSKELSDGQIIEYLDKFEKMDDILKRAMLQTGQ